MIAARPDLLVIGGLTVDRFADGSSAPGGSVLHIARAAAPRGLRVAAVTVAGPEPEARAGLDELRRLLARLDASQAPATARFMHRDSHGGRRLWLEQSGARIHLSDPGSRPAPRAILVAPIADEIAPDDVARLGAGSKRGAILQGFLRSPAGDGEIRPRPLSALAPALTAALGGLDLVVASREDLLGEAAEPADQLTALRSHLGAGPELVVTDGVRGVWTEAEHLPVPRLIEGVPSIGAGDIFAAFLLAGDRLRRADAGSLRQRAEGAMRVVAEVLEGRR